MLKFDATITDADGQTGTYTGVIAHCTVNTSNLKWNGPADYLSSQTSHYHLAISGGEEFAMSGDAYRNIDQFGYIPRFELLASLDPVAARNVMSFAEKGDTLYRSLVTTSDATMSCTLFSSTNDEEEILDLAKEQGSWELNEGNPVSEVYLAAGAGDDIEEIGISDLIDELLRDAKAKAISEAQTQALEFAKLVARLSKSGEAAEGESVKAVDITDLEDSHDALMKLIDNARGILGAIA